MRDSRVRAVRTAALDPKSRHRSWIMAKMHKKQLNDPRRTLNLINGENYE